MASPCHQGQPEPCDIDHVTTVFHKTAKSSMILILFAAVVLTGLLSVQIASYAWINKTSGSC